jgi:hypothetical protein
MVGLFTFMSIGSAVIWDLWGIMDIRRGHEMVSPSPLKLFKGCQLIPDRDMSGNTSYIARLV